MAFWNRSKSSGGNSISVDTQQVSLAAQQIESSRSQMKKIVEEMNTIINNLESDWDSSVCSDFKTRVDKTKEVYDSFDSILSNVSSFLNQVSGTYEENENAINNSANNF